MTKIIINEKFRRLVEQKSTKKNCVEMISKLFHSQTQSHIFHLQTKSHSEHKALQKFYEEIEGLIDGIVESYQGKYGIITGYESYDIVGYQNNSQVIKYFEGLEKDVEELRESIEDSFLQNEIDNVVKLINTTLYKLKFLK